MDGQREGWADVALAAEFKRASPSKGEIAVGLDIRGAWWRECSGRTDCQALTRAFVCVLSLAEQVRQYAEAGASMISVLTEPTWFKGSLEDMQAARDEVQALPQRPAILRKDFIFDEYQLLEARAFGADCVLLIVASLDATRLAELIDVRCRGDAALLLAGGLTRT
jgi:anthranilate synthase/indole-3-glycerol phosphate synthase/phosphoribosylanthranilate isomerase